MAFLHMLGWMIVLHALLDYPLQGDFLSKAKNRRAPIPGVPWWQALTAHAVIQAGGVALVTGSPIFALAEFAVHWLTDDAKCRNAISYNTDQAIHVGCKAVWAAGALLWLA